MRVEPTRCELTSRGLLQQLFGFVSGRVVGGQVGLEIALQQLACDVKIAAGADVGIGAVEQDLGLIRGELRRSVEELVTFEMAALFGEESGQVHEAAGLGRRKLGSAA